MQDQEPRFRKRSESSHDQSKRVHDAKFERKPEQEFDLFDPRNYADEVDPAGDEAGVSEIPRASNLMSEVSDRARQASGNIDVARKGQIATGVGGIASTGSLSYFLGQHTDYFQSGITGAETPLYFGFLALAFMAGQNLLSICGRKAPKETLAGILSGGGTGLSLALGVAGIAFTAAVDLAIGGTLKYSPKTGQVFKVVSSLRCAEEHGAWHAVDAS